MIVSFSDESEKNVGAMQKKNCYIIMNEKKKLISTALAGLFLVFFLFSFLCIYSIL